MKKILVVVSDMKMGGVTSSAINFCNELTKRGDIVHFLNMGKQNPLAESKISKSVKQLRLDGKAVNWQLGMSDLSGISMWRRLRLLPWAVIKKATNHSGKWNTIIFKNYLIPEEYDVAIAFRQCAPCYYFVLKCTNAKKKIAFIHGDVEHMGDISSFDSFFYGFDFVACVSNAVRDGFKKAYSQLDSRFVTVYNMVDVDSVLEMSQEEPERNLYRKGHIILTVSRIEESPKKIHRITEICKLLIEKGICNFHWYVVGDGPDIKKNIEYSEKMGVSQHLTFYGGTENPYPLYRHCDFTVLTSSWESYGLVVVESLILGKPVIAMRYPALTEILEDGKFGIITEQCVSDMAKKLADVLTNNAFLDELKTNCSYYKFSNDTAYDQFMALL